MHKGTSSNRPSISLTDLEREVLELSSSDNLRDPGNDNITLFARVLSSKEINHKTFHIKMCGHWKGRYPVTISDHHTGLFMNHYIVLASPSPLQNVTVKSLHYSPFWIQLHRLPFLSKSKAIAVWAGNIFGSFLEVDEESLNEGWGPFLCFQAMIDVSNPLLRGKMARIRDSRDELWIEFRYERLPEFCFECGVIGHPFESCSIFLDQLCNGIEPSLSYGLELMGSPIPSSGYDRYRTNFGKVTCTPSFSTYPPSSRTIASPFNAHNINHATPQPTLFSSATVITIPPHLSMHANSQSRHIGHPVPSSTLHFKENINPNKFAMNILSWNARGLGNPTAFRHLRLLISEQAPCVLFLMETKLQSGSISKFRNSLHFPHGIEVPQIGLSGGVMLLWKSDKDIAINNYSSNHIDCFVEFHDGQSFHFTGFYGHPQVNQRIHTWTKLKRCFNVAPLRPWLVMGDFNENFADTSQSHFTALKHSEANLDELLSQEETYWHHRGIDQFALEAVLSTIPTTISIENHAILSQPYTSEDVYHALKSMSEYRSPGLDGMSVMFYTNYWPIVGSLVTSAVLDVLNNGCDPTLLNRTLITLIPKVKKPTKITQYRPISLCNVLYKLVSKTIVLRLQPFLHLVISEFQSAFLSQHLITDNVLVAFEVLHSIKNRKRGNKGFAAMKLDMSKAFDRVEWHLIQQVMLKMGFGDTIVQIISRCVQSVSYSFLLNGAIHGNITPHRGIRQGDPLSPYLFLICSECFSRLLQHEENQGNLEGLNVSRFAPPVSHLLFADDSVLFCRASRSSATAVNRCLDLHSRASGQVINHDKCVLSFSPNTRVTEQNFFQHLLGMPIQPCHERYLGLPSFSGHDKNQLFSGINDTIWKLLNSWREQLFSVGGKEVLLKAVVQAIPTYGMSCFQLPAKLCHQIEQQMARHFNQALLAKQAWRLMKSPNSLLSRILKNKYYVNGHLLHAGVDSLCPICKLQNETIPHALLYCKRAKQEWNQWDHFPVLHLSRITSISDFMIHVSPILSKELFELFITVMWCVWSERNAEFHGKKTKPVPTATSTTIKTQAKWIAPPSGKLKLNTDAFINMSSSLIGLGALLQNSHGEIVASMTTSIKGHLKPEEMEAVALFWSLKTLLQLELSVHLIETDSLLVVQNLKKSSTNLTPFHAILNDVHLLVSNFPRAQISHVYRSTNNEAHLLAKFALTVDTECIWLEEIPPPLMTVM
uniref:Reverse transcriptase domain-containing protein n=1 Tax=Cannabis sativa TaxID=3483 RepID=A0A803PQT0_CANSA